MSGPARRRIYDRPGSKVVRRPRAWPSCDRTMEVCGQALEFGRAIARELIIGCRVTQIHEGAQSIEPLSGHSLLAQPREPGARRFADPAAFAFGGENCLHAAIGVARVDDATRRLRGTL